MQRNAHPTLIPAGALLSVVAALVHASVVREHFDEWCGYGVFFVVVTLAQVLYAPLLIFRPYRWVLFAGIVGNLAVIGLWVVTRTEGIPLFGPEAGEVEAVGTPDVISKLAELLLVVVLGALLAHAEDAERAAEA